MKIVVPTSEGKLCAHFGHCDTFSFVEVDEGTREIVEIVTATPEGGVSCQSAGWIATLGVKVALVGGIGARPLSMLAESGIKVVAGCPELDVSEIVKMYLDNNLIVGENACASGEHHHCGGHGASHHRCGGKH